MDHLETAVASVGIAGSIAVVAVEPVAEHCKAAVVEQAFAEVA